jgi:hypothetical protein
MDHVDEQVRGWMRAKHWEVTATDYHFDQEIYAWRHQQPGGKSHTARFDGLSFSCKGTMNKSKQQRQDDAHNAAFERVAKQALALTFAFLRVDALFQKYDEEMQSIRSSGEPGEQRRKSTVEATKRVENTP